MVATGRDSAAVSLRGWALEAEAAAGIARALAPTPFVPDQLRRYVNPEAPASQRELDFEGTVATVSAVLLAGQELEFGPMASLRAITIIRGSVALYAIACRAILQRHGHDIIIKESTDNRAIVMARRAGTNDWQTATWTLDRARLMGLYPGKPDSNWRRQPKSMLVARATAEAARWVASDAMLGLPMIVEEVEDTEAELLALPPGQADDNGQGSTGAEPRQATAKRKRRGPAASSSPPALAPEPSAPPAPPPRPTDHPRPDEPGITPPQRSKLYAGLKDIGVGARDNREEALALLGAWIGRTVTSTSDLTQAEAGTVLDRLQALKTIGARPAAAQQEEPDPDPAFPREEGQDRDPDG